MPSLSPTGAGFPSLAAALAAFLAGLAVTAAPAPAESAVQPTVLRVDITAAGGDAALAEEVAFLLREALLEVEGLSVLPRRSIGGPDSPTITGNLSRNGTFRVSLSPGDDGPARAAKSGGFDGTSPHDGADRIYGSLLPDLRHSFASLHWPPSLAYPTVSTMALRLYVEGIMAAEEADRLVLLTRSADADPGFAAPLVARGRMLLASGAMDAAMEDFRLALDSRPGHREAHTGLGTVYLRRGDTGVAESHFREALRTDPLYGEAKRNLNEILGMKKAALPSSPPPADAKYSPPPKAGGGGENVNGEGRPPRKSRAAGGGEAADDLETARQQLDDVELEMELFLSVGMDKEAADARRKRDGLMNEVTRLRGEVRAPDAGAARAAVDETSRPSAERGEPEGLPREENRAEIYRLHGEEALRRNAAEEAVELFEAYLSVGGRHADTIYSLAELHLQLGRYARSRELFAAAARAYEEMKQSAED